MPKKPSPNRVSHGPVVMTKLSHDRIQKARQALRKLEASSRSKCRRCGAPYATDVPHHCTGLDRRGPSQPESVRPPILSRTLGEIVAAVGGLLAQEAYAEPLAAGVVRCYCGAEVVGAPMCWLCSNPVREQLQIGGGA